MESARINPKNPQGDYLLRPSYDVLNQIRLHASFHEIFVKNGVGRGKGGEGDMPKPSMRVL